MAKKFEITEFRQNISDYADTRIKTMLKQSYNFDSPIIEQLAEEALKRNLLTEQELSDLLEQNEFKQKEMLVRQREEIRIASLNDPDEDYKNTSTFGKILTAKNILPVVPLIICAVVYIFTKQLFIVGIGAALSGLAYSRNSSIFRR